VDSIILAQGRDYWIASCEHCNENLGSRKAGDLLDYLNDSRFIKKTSAPWNRLNLVGNEEVIRSLWVLL
jgi:hypothetical protein